VVSCGSLCLLFEMKAFFSPSTLFFLWHEATVLFFTFFHLPLFPFNVSSLVGTPAFPSPRLFVWFPSDPGFSKKLS